MKLAAKRLVLHAVIYRVVMPFHFAGWRGVR